MNKIEVINVSKEFKNQEVLKNVSLSLNSGKIYGFVGKNGSGKTVLLKIITGILKPTNGDVKIDGQLLHQDIDFPKSCGVIIDKPEFFEDLSGFKNLKILADIKKEIDDSKIDSYLKLFGLKNDRKSVKKYSLGMKQRLGLVQAFMEEPELVILDEFTNGLDSEGVKFVIDYIKNYLNDNRIIILTSHYENDLMALVDELYSVDGGKVSKYDL